MDVFLDGNSFARHHVLKKDWSFQTQQAKWNVLHITVGDFVVGDLRKSPKSTPTPLDTLICSDLTAWKTKITALILKRTAMTWWVFTYYADRFKTNGYAGNRWTNKYPISSLSSAYVHVEEKNQAKSALKTLRGLESRPKILGMDYRQRPGNKNQEKNMEKTIRNNQKPTSGPTNHQKSILQNIKSYNLQ